MKVDPTEEHTRLKLLQRLVVLDDQLLSFGRGSTESS